ncbi:polysaccharide deacetylase family protein [Glacieibacterium megasporae]|uniref:polysaccharide deacetylase family protein n=1 Tax=Glacieibacterium megasporae TaxID=2835787 RepID=UPI001C1E6A38|nr:polysaccharide deacetylase family protein [Polymorphobacter megasporae]UAJ10785.1 polysaccharide deacetylase family protein [Polymorphobacter megasporae]
MSRRRFLPAIAALIAIGAASAQARPSIAVTFDDLPAHGPLPIGTTRLAIVGDIVAALKASRVGEVYGFVNGVLTERENDMPVLQLWRDAGLPIGNHGWSHLNLDDVGAPVASADIVRNESLVAALAGTTDWHWFRYPYLAEGRDPATRLALRHELIARGYRIAAVTMSFDDYLWNPPYARCLANHDAAAITQLETSYLTAAANAADEARANAKALYGRDIPYVLLMHAGAFDARMLPRLLALYRQKSFAFTTLGKAESDPAYAADIDPSLPPVATIRDRVLAAGKTLAPRTDIAPVLAAMCPTPPS